MTGLHDAAACRRTNSSVGIYQLPHKFKFMIKSNISKKTQHLLEKFCNGKAFTTFAIRTEPAINPIEDLNTVQIRYEMGPGPRCWSTGRKFLRYVEF